MHPYSLRRATVGYKVWHLLSSRSGMREACRAGVGSSREGNAFKSYNLR